MEIENKENVETMQNAVETQENKEVNPEIENEGSENGGEPKNEIESSFFVDVNKFAQSEENNEPEEDPEISALKELKSLVDSDELVKGYISAKKAGVSFKEYVDTMLTPDYSENEPERVFKDYLKKQMNLDSDELEYEYSRFMGDSDNLSAAQKLQIRNWAKELNEGKVKPDWDAQAQARVENIKKSEESVKSMINGLENIRIGGRENPDGTLEGGFVFDKKAIEKTNTLQNAIKNGAFINPDGTIKPELINMIAIYANLKEILYTISSSSASDGKLEILKKQANLRSPSGTMPSGKMTKAANSLSEQFKLAQQELQSKGLL